MSLNTVRSALPCISALQNVRVGGSYNEMSWRTEERGLVKSDCIVVLQLLLPHSVKQLPGLRRCCSGGGFNKLLGFPVELKGRGLHYDGVGGAGVLNRQL